MKSKETFNQTVGLNVCKYRKLHGYTQASLAEKLNYSDKAVAKWESGESLPEPFVLYQLCEIFGVTLNDLTSDKKKVKMPIGKFKQIACTCVLVKTLQVYHAMPQVRHNSAGSKEIHLNA